MTAEAAQLGKHKHLGTDCKWCGAVADVVATYQRGVSEGNPFGSLKHVPLCNACGLVALNGHRPPRLTPHEAAVLRQDKERKEARAALRKANGAAQTHLEV